ncbi:dienelactone hydrolase family protein [Marinovum sp.]|uniref:dienelactone hydrolase family protein n=1 Tax=Marinovum sp. TaxID=2024839 RepID=UPI002B265F60|nr:dienelactone hydrolase family protein [Marinovum sp.]
MILTKHDVDIETPTGPMRTGVFQPAEPGRYPALLFYSEIFQRTAPIERAAALMAGHGFIVLVPEVFHELNPIGTVLAYDDAGKDKGNSDKWEKPLESHDSDTVAMLDYLASLDSHNGRTGGMGVCIGGHLAFRAALNPGIAAASCLYATDLHSDTLPAAPGNGTLERCGDIEGEMMMVWGRQDPHVPTEGRAKVHHALMDAGVTFAWHEVNAQHAFMRDEGDRYDPELALFVYQQSVALFRRCLA